MSDTTTVHPDGSIVRVTGRDEQWEAEMVGGSRVGGKYLVAYYVGDPDPAEDPQERPFYYLDDLGSPTGGAYAVLAEHVELVKTAADVDRSIPSAKDIARELDLMIDHPFDVHETDLTGEDGEVTCYATTADGVGFTFTVQVTEVEYT